MDDLHDIMESRTKTNDLLTSNACPPDENCHGWQEKQGQSWLSYRLLATIKKIASVIKLNKHLDFCIKILPCTQHNHKGPSCFLPCPARVLLLGNNKQLMLYNAQLFS